MARKVFLSVLGNGFYTKYKYGRENFECKDSTRFIQIATLEYIDAQNWSADDAVFILMTNGAREANWNNPKNGTRINPQTQKEEPYIGLEKEIEKMNLHVVNQIDQEINDGNTEDEMWKIFSKLYSLIKENDELYLDLTHSFRYIPMLMMVFCNYAKFLKKVTIKKITYGNIFVKKNDVAIINDITTLSVLQDWTAAADEFISTGNVQKLSKLYLPHINQRLKESKGADKDAQILDKLVKDLKSLMNEFKLCQGKLLIETKTINSTKHNISTVSQIKKPEPFGPILEEIDKSLIIFDNKQNVINGISAAKWCSENGLYQQAATLLQESIVSLICEKVGFNWKKEIKRKYVNNAFNVLADKKLSNNPDLWSVPYDKDYDEEKRKEIFCGIMSLNLVQELVKEFSELTSIRNKINHGTMLEDKQFKNVDMVAERITFLTNQIYNKIVKANE